MTSLASHRIWSWRIRLGVGTCALALVVLLGRVLVMTPSAEAHAGATFTLLYSFKGGADGSNPAAGLVRDAAGNLYGTTLGGGTSGYGTAFKLDTTGAETVLHSFSGSSGDGALPYAGLVRDAAGNLYGTTYGGGRYDMGAAFKLDTTGAETTLHSFGFRSDGRIPLGGLIRDAAGNLYGTASEGGASGQGTVFKLDRTGAETVLHIFTGSSGDGAVPGGDLVRDAAGNLYGTTYAGGASDMGTVFRLETTGTETVLYSFRGKPLDGAHPRAGLVRDAAGNLYGTTLEGGASDKGTVFKLDTTGAETVLHSFTGVPDGRNPYGGLVRDAAGYLYGTTYKGGASDHGTVFRLHR